MFMQYLKRERERERTDVYAISKERERESGGIIMERARELKAKTNVTLSHRRSRCSLQSKYSLPCKEKTIPEFMEQVLDG